MLRNIMAVIAGIAAAFLTVFLLERLGHLVFTLPPMPKTAAEAGTYMAQVALLPKLALVATNFLAALAGVLVARLLAPARWPIWTVVATFLAATIANFFAFPHPAWMIAAELVLPLLAGYLVDRPRVRT